MAATDHMLTEKEKALRDWLRTIPDGAGKWLLIKAGFRRSYAQGVSDSIEAIDALTAFGDEASGISAALHAVERVQILKTEGVASGPRVPASPEEWQQGRWWRAIGPDGDLWCESSDEAEVRREARPGDRVENLYETVQKREWRSA